MLTPFLQGWSLKGIKHLTTSKPLCNVQTNASHRQHSPRVHGENRSPGRQDALSGQDAGGQVERQAAAQETKGSGLLMTRVAICIREVISFGYGRQTRLIAYDRNHIQLWSKVGAEANRVAATMRRNGVSVVERRIRV